MVERLIFVVDLASWATLRERESIQQESTIFQISEEIKVQVKANILLQFAVYTQRQYSKIWVASCNLQTAEQTDRSMGLAASNKTTTAIKKKNSLFSLSFKA